MIEKQNQLPASCPLTFTGAPKQMHPHLTLEFVKTIRKTAMESQGLIIRKLGPRSLVAYQSLAPFPRGPHTFRAIPRGHHAVTLGFTLLQGGWPQGLSALSGWLARVASAPYCALLLAEATL